MAHNIDNKSPLLISEKLEIFPESNKVPKKANIDDIIVNISNFFLKKINKIYGTKITFNPVKTEFLAGVV